jgi:molybdate transport system substrate-binding protein
MDRPSARLPLLGPSPSLTVLRTMRRTLALRLAISLIEPANYPFHAPADRHGGPFSHPVAPPAANIFYWMKLASRDGRRFIDYRRLLILCWSCGPAAAQSDDRQAAGCSATRPALRPEGSAREGNSRHTPLIKRLKPHTIRHTPWKRLDWTGFEHNPRIKGGNMSSRQIATAFVFLAGLISCLVCGTVEGNATEVKVLGAVAMKAPLDELFSQFERETGDKVTVSYGTAGSVRDRLQTGEAVDVVILPQPRMDEVTRQTRVVPESTVKLASTLIAVAVREGAPKPDITSSDALKRALLAVSSVSYSDPAKGGAGGIYFSSALERLGIADEVKRKTKLTPGPEAPVLVARGDVEMAVALISEIVPVRGAALVGPLPQELQSPSNFVYVAGIPPGATESSGARNLIQFLSGAHAAPVYKSKGMEPE